jgi:hydrogenase maturation protein HypF
VVRSTARGAIPMRRARGHVPDAIALPAAGKVVLGVGGHERNTVCLVRDGQAVLSQHVGDLDQAESDAFFREAIAHLQELLGAAPEAVVHDLHPDYRSTRWARASGLRTVAVQHHHAHVAACLAEHGRHDRVTGIAFDGTGLGDDGTLWGGEVLDADLAASRRVGHLRALRLAGGEAAIREPWRLAAAALVDAGESLDRLPHVAAGERERLSALLATSLPARATGAGRWFDAVAALLGAARDISYDGQAAAQLEALAGREHGAPLAFAITAGEPFELDLRPAIRELVRELVHGTSAAQLAARFHATIAAAIVVACRSAGRPAVVLTGGCFQNRRLLEETTALLEAEGFEVMSHHRVPPNDGGLALGQVAIATCGGSSCV